MLRITTISAIAGIVSSQQCLPLEGDTSTWVFPSPSANPSQTVCNSYQTETCCTPDYTTRLAKEGVAGLYDGWDPNHCAAVTGKNMSNQCAAFWMWEECWFMCDPYIAYYYDKTEESDIKGLPLCANMCEDWFNACADDYTCVVDMMNFPKNGTGDYECQQPCQTYRDTYGSAEAMCNSIMNTSFRYSTNADSCYSFKFWGNHNPNVYAANISKSGAESSTLAFAAVALIALASTLLV